jgi:hypothetical protein
MEAPGRLLGLPGAEGLWLLHALVYCPDPLQPL